MGTRKTQSAAIEAGDQSLPSDDGLSKQVREDFGRILARTVVGRLLSARVRARLQKKQPICVFVRTGTEELSRLVRAGLVMHGFDQVVVLDNERGKRTKPDEVVLQYLMHRGVTILVGAADFVNFPLASPKLADLHLTLEVLDHLSVSRAIRTLTNKSVPSEIYQIDLSSLSMEEVLTCVALGATPRDIITKLRTVASTKASPVSSAATTLPDLDTAPGYGEARLWALELRQDLRDYAAGKIAWRDVDRGAVLFGPPGSGKTLFAQIVARSCGVQMVQTSIATLFQSTRGYLNELIREQRAVFEQARKKAPCLLFIDELDSLPSRDMTEGDRNETYWRSIINDFLMLLDSSISEREGVVVVGATNRLQDVDRALLRPGRLERSIYIGPPDAAGLASIIRYYLGDELPGIELEAACRQREGATGAQAEEWVRAARRLARRADRPMVPQDLLSQINLPDPRSEAELLRTSIHEAGHAAIGVLLGQEVRFVSIEPLGPTGGRTGFAVSRGSRTRDDLERQVIGLLAGRAAEQVLLDEAPTSGAMMDLAQATNVLASVRVSFGMGDSLVFLGNPDETPTLLAMDADLRKRVKEDLDRLMERARSLVAVHAEMIREVAARLRSTRVLSGEGVREVMASALI